MKGKKRTPLAIVGIGCRLPGGSADPELFWKLLRSGESGIREVPADRWNLHRFYSPDPEVPAKMITRWGGFVKDIDKFDARFFGISPREALRMDPQQRWLLEVAWEAFEDGGIPPDSLAGSATGVFVGIASNDYANIQMRGPSEVDVHTNSGSTLSIASNRISYLFDFKGPSISVDTACSSALVAINLACHSIWDGQCSQALAGGVNALITPDSSIGFSKASMLSPSGQCFAFDARANGYVRGEGAGMLVLKPLTEAQKDRNPIYAVVRAAVTNQDGRTNAMTVPGLESQSEMLEVAYREAGIQPNRVCYMEAHGTGTPVGDPIELRALGHVLCRDRPKGQSCVIGSVKTNIGHLESGSGVAGVIKAALVLKHREIPPNLNFETPNPNIPFDELQLRVPTEVEPLSDNGTLPVVAVNSFGFGGTNAHVVLEAAPKLAATSRRASSSPVVPFMVSISAKTTEALADYAKSFRMFLLRHEKDTAITLPDISYSSLLRKNHHEHRLVVIGLDKRDISRKLKAWTNSDEETDGVVCGQATSDLMGPVFVFSGQGPQWWGMGQELFRTEPVFRKTLEKINRLFSKHSGWSIIDELHRTEEDSRIDQTDVAQPAIFALQVGLAEMWRSRGVEAERVVGHSVGEVAAAYWAGVYTLDDAVKVIYHRSRLQASAGGSGRMVAVGISPKKALEVIRGHESAIALAVINSPSMVTLAGDMDELETVVARLETEGTFVRWLQINYAFHTYQMDPIQAELIEVLSGISPQPTRIPYISTVTGAELPGEQIDAHYWWRNVREPVEFSKAVWAVVDKGSNLFLELGPHPIHTAAINECVAKEGAKATVVHSLVRGKSEREQLIESAGMLHAVGYPLQWESFFSGEPQFVRLPYYPWQHESFWLESEESAHYRLSGPAHPLLGVRVRAPHPTWENTIDPRILLYLEDHCFWNSMIFPASGYAEIGFAVARELYPKDCYVVEDLKNVKALFFSQTNVPTIRIVFDAADHSFRIYSASGSRTEWELHAQGRIQEMTEREANVVDLESVRNRLERKVDHADYYQEYKDAGYQFGPMFNQLRNVWKQKGESVGKICVPESLRDSLGDYSFHPAVLDACFQCVKGGQVIPDGSKPSDNFYLPASVGRIWLYRPVPDELWAHVKVVHDTRDVVIADIDVRDNQGMRIAEIRAFRVERVEQSDGGSASDLDKCLYEYGWEPLHLRGSRVSGSAHMPNPDDIVAALPPLIEEVYEKYELIIYFREYAARFEEICYKFTVDAFYELGWEPEIGDRFTIPELINRLGVVEDHHRLMGALAEMFYEEGVLEPAGDGYWAVVAIPERADAEAGLDELTRDFLQFESEIPLMRVCLTNLAKVLCGAVDPLKLIFPAGYSEKFDRFYKEGADFKAYNELIEQVVTRAVENLPNDRAIRVLEIGAGTGSLTKSVLPVLPAERTEYSFTDIGIPFISEARKQFSNFQFVEYSILDIEKDPLAQGVDLNSYDLVLATNVLHTTADLRHTLDNVKRLLDADGMLVFLEVTRQRRFLDLVFGLLKGWWNFTDTDLREKSALLPRADWESLLRERGFRNVTSFVTSEHSQDRSQTVFLATSPELERPLTSSGPVRTKNSGTEAGLYLILADKEDIGNSLATCFEKEGIDYVVARPGKEFREIDDKRFEFRLGSGPDLVRLIKAIRNKHSKFKGIVHCLSLDQPSAEGLSVGELDEAQHSGVLSVMHLAQALLKVDFDSEPRVWVVTRDAQSVRPDDKLAGVASTPVFGMMRVANNEHGAYRWTAVDLDPEGALEPTITCLRDGIVLEDSEPEVAFRAGRRFVNRLRRVSFGELPRRTRNALQPGHAVPFRLEIPTPGVLGNLSLRETERSALGLGEVEVNVAAGGINFRDVMKVLGMYPGDSPDLKWLGDDFAGTVLAVGEGVEDIQVGDEVVGMAPYCFRSYVNTHRHMVFRKPADMSFEEAATLPTVFLTAHYALNHLARLQKGERVLIHAGSGGIGHAAIQLARLVGAEVFSTASTPEKRDYVRALGATYVMNSRTLDFADEIMEITGGEGVDVVLNQLAGDFIPKNFSVLAPFGRFLEIGTVDIYQNAKIGLEPFKNNISYYGIHMGQHMVSRPAYIAQMFGELSELFEKKELRPLPLKSFPITEAVEAFRHMAQARHIGKNVLNFKVDSIPVAPLVEGRDLFRPDASYLITAGFGGFGLEVAKWMSEHGARTLVLMSRSGPRTEEEKNDIAALREGGVEIVESLADVTSEEDVAGVMDRIRRNHSPLKGIIHGAMVLDDEFISDLTTERFQNVLRPKMLGAWLLHKYSFDLELDHFICFSSISSFVGAGRQSNYCAGNLFLDALAHHRHALGLPALTFNWGAFSGAGFVHRNKTTAEYLDKIGMSSFTIEEGLSVFAKVLPTDPVQLGVARIDWKQLSKVNPALAASRPFSCVMGDEVGADGLASGSSIRPRILAATAPDQLQIVQDFIAEQVAQVFGTTSAKIDRETPLTQIGLDSLMAIELMNRLESSLGINLPMSQFLQGPNINELAVSVLELLIHATGAKGDAMLLAGDEGSSLTVEAADGEVKEFPLSYGQQALWFLNRLAPKSSAYNLLFSSRITPYVEIDVMEKAFAALFRRHPMLDVVFSAETGAPVQRLQDDRTIDFREHDARELGDDEIKELLVEHAIKPFDLQAGPVIRLELFRLDGSHIALLSMHHIISDAWSVVLLMNDLIESYFSIQAGLEPKFMPLEHRYSDYVRWQRNLLESEASQRMRQYWLEQLQGAPQIIDLPTDHPRPPVQTFNGATHGFRMNEELTRKIQTLSNESNVTLNTTLLSAFQILLHRYCNQDDLIVGSPFAGRNRPEFKNLVGYFVNPVPLRSRVADDPVYTDYLDRVSQSVNGAIENQEFPLPKLVDDLKVKRDASRSPIFQVTFSMERIPDADEQGIAVFLIGQGGYQFNVENLKIESIDLNLRQAQFEISLVVEEAGGNIYGCWQYNRDLFEPETIEHLNALYEQILDDVTTHPHKRISEISFLTQEEERKILEEWNATAVEHPADMCLHQLVAEHAARIPSALAVSCSGTNLTYEQLDSRANGLGLALQESGVSLETPVAILIDRSVDMLVGALGILKSGGCYVPLDPAFPQFRLAQMLEDAQPPVVVSQRHLATSLPKGPWKTIFVDEIGPSRRVPEVEGLNPESTAYIIYTSGSTGLPKGVMIPHCAVVNFLTSMKNTPGLSPDDSLLAVTTLSFDISVLELFLPLVSDARVVIATREEVIDGRRLSTLMDEYAVTTMQATPAMWQMLLDSGWNGKHDLRVFCGGETLSRELAESLLPCTRAVWNLYGPTETTIWSTVDRVTSGTGTVSIGRPIANTTVYILDDNNNAVPPNFVGHLYIGGSGLATGYYGQSGLTAEKFIELTLPNGRTERLYRTGDLARFTADGKIDFMGRSDFQVKLRGYRIELDEIEAHLRGHPGVREAVVLKRDDLPGGENLCAYIVPDKTSADLITELRGYLMERLPDYMRPAVYQLIAEIPLTPNKKVDRLALPIPSVAREDLVAEFAVPRTPSERILIDILKQAFKTEDIGIKDNFFELGGDSLLAVQILTEISQVFNRPLPVDVFLQNPTVENLAHYLEFTPVDADAEHIRDVDAEAGGGTLAQEILDSDYLKVEMIDGGGKHRGRLPRADSVALAYIPDAFLSLAGLSRDDLVRNWFHGEPYASNLFETSFGRIGLVMLPHLGAELYKDQKIVSKNIVRALELAWDMGAKQVSLTGLIPSATDYGLGIAEWTDGRDNVPVITTGHATTTATIIKSIEGILAKTGRQLDQEDVAIVGLGSIGYATLRLMLEVMPHPRALTLCDLYQKSDALETIREELAGEIGFRGTVRLEPTRGQLPEAIYDASFIFGATNVPGILDINRVKPGTLIVDDSFPPCFRVFDAIKRIETRHDILFTTGGLIRLPNEIRETIYLPSATVDLLEEISANQLLALAGRNPFEITGCILASLLTGSDHEIKPTLGPVKVSDSLAHYHLLDSIGSTAALLQCEGYFISPETVERFNEVTAGGPERTDALQEV